MQNIVFAASLFALHHKKLELDRWLFRLPPAPISPNRNKPPITNKALIVFARPTYLHWSLSVSLVVVFVNVANAIVCEVGEWQHWMTATERDLLRAANLNLLALQGL